MHSAAEHQIGTRLDWMGDPAVPHGVQEWVVYYCTTCGAEGDELDERPCHRHDEYE